MARLKLFEYHVILHPKDPEKGDSELIIKPDTLMASDAKEAAFMVTRLIPEKHAKEFSRIDIGIRSFNKGKKSKTRESSSPVDTYIASSGIGVQGDKGLTLTAGGPWNDLTTTSGNYVNISTTTSGGSYFNAADALAGNL